MISLSKAEKSYIQAGILGDPPHRSDGRALHEYRTVALETGVAPLSNGSARLTMGRGLRGGGGTEVLAATKLEVEDVKVSGVDGGRVVCSVTCSPAAYPHLSSGALEDLQYDMTTILNQTLSHPSLHPPNLSIVKGQKSWLLNLDLVVLSDAGNIYDALFMASRAALWDTKVPRTRSVEYKTAANRNTGGMEIDDASGLDTRQQPSIADFELHDFWDEGEPLEGREAWPVSVTLNLISPMHYLDASAQEEAATPLRLLLAFSFSPSGTSLQGMRVLGVGELDAQTVKQGIEDGEKYAREVYTALNAKLNDEDVRRNQKASHRFTRR